MRLLVHFVNYCFHLLYSCHGSAEWRRVPCLATAGGVLLRAAGAPADVGRGTRTLAHSVSRAAPARAGPAIAYGTPGRPARLPCVQRDWVGGQAGSQGGGPATAVC